MKVFVTGATGALGRSVVPQLVAAGHEVVGVARDDAKARWLRAQGATPAAVDLFDAVDVPRAVSGCDAVAHLATNVPAGARAIFPGGWAQHNRLRTEATPLLVAAARATGARVFVKESICFLYQDGGDRLLDEDAPLVDGPIAEPAYVGERAALAMGDGRRARAVVLRFGLFYGPNARMVDEWLGMAKLGRVSIAGGTDAYQPSIHLDDAASAVVAALDAPSGVYNVCDETLTKGAYLQAFADAFGLRRTPKPVPAWVVGLLGRKLRYLSASQRVSNERFYAATGWRPRYASAREGWPAVAHAWRASRA